MDCADGYDTEGSFMDRSYRDNATDKYKAVDASKNCDSNTGNSPDARSESMDWSDDATIDEGLSNLVNEAYEINLSRMNDNDCEYPEPMDWSDDATIDKGLNNMTNSEQETHLSGMHFGMYPSNASVSYSQVANIQPPFLHYSSASFVFMNSTTTFFIDHQS